MPCALLFLSSLWEMGGLLLKDQWCLLATVTRLALMSPWPATKDTPPWWMLPRWCATRLALGNHISRRVAVSWDVWYCGVCGGVFTLVTHTRPHIHTHHIHICQPCTHTYIHTTTYKCTHTHIHTCAHTHTHTHTHTLHSCLSFVRSASQRHSIVHWTLPKHIGYILLCSRLRPAGRQLFEVSWQRLLDWQCPQMWIIFR